MADVIRDRWIEFTEALEGGVPYLYADIRGLITIAYGDLVDPMSAALQLPLLRTDGTAASRQEITAEWLRLKGDALAASRGHLYARGITSLRLSKESMADLALAKLDTNTTVLRARLTDWDSYPASARMALSSLAWACGPAFHFPKLISACQARDWDAASIHIQMNEFTPEGKRNAGLIPRNTRNRILMQNAARVDAFKLDPDLLNWDAVLGVQDADTQPDIHLPSSIPPPLPDLGAITEEYNHEPLEISESTASQPTRAPAAADYLGSDPDDDAA